MTFYKAFPFHGLRCRFGIAFALLFVSPGLLSASFDLTQMPSKLPLKNEYHVIKSAGPSQEPGILKFEVYCPHANYEVQGFIALEKILREIEIIERVTHQKGGGGFLEGASDSVEATAVGLGNLVVHPVESAKGLGKAAGKISSSIGGVFNKKSKGEKTSFGEKMMGSNRRDVAKKIGADIYSRNPHMQNLIQGIANAQAGGKGVVLVLEFIVPIALIASVVITAGTINTAADKMVDDLSRGELYKENKKALTVFFGNEGAAVHFLETPYLTPREQTYFRFYMDKLKNIEGIAGIFQGMTDARSQWDALRKLYEAQMAAGTDSKQFAKIWSFPEGTAVLSLSGRMLLFTAYDHLSPGAVGNRVLARVQALRAQNNFPVEIRNGGQIADDFKSQAQRAGISVRPWVFFESESEK